MREYTVPAAARIVVDGRVNGGISVKGANRKDVLVRAKVETWAPSESDAKGIAGLSDGKSGKLHLCKVLGNAQRSLHPRTRVRCPMS
jgi:hypothetical protein